MTTAVANKRNWREKVILGYIEEPPFGTEDRDGRPRDIRTANGCFLLLQGERVAVSRV
jgi:hypothetical protein